MSQDIGYKAARREQFIFEVKCIAVLLVANGLVIYWMFFS